MDEARQLFERVDKPITTWMARYGLLFLRLSLGVVFFWFGFLKFFPDLSPAQDLAARTIEQWAMFTPGYVDRLDPQSDNPILVQDMRVTPSVFRMFDIDVVLGRPLLENDVDPASPPVALISYDLWQSRFGGDTNVIGRTMRVAGTLTTIVGVAPRGFYAQVQIWRPYRPGADLAGFRGSGAAVYGRLRDGLAPAVGLAAERLCVGAQRLLVRLVAEDLGRVPDLTDVDPPE